MPKVTLLFIVLVFFSREFAFGNFSMTVDFNKIEVGLVSPQTPFLKCIAGQSSTVLLKISNFSDQSLHSAKGDDALDFNTVNASYRIYQNSSTVLVHEGLRFDLGNEISKPDSLKRVLGPHSSSFVPIMISCPKNPGQYDLVLDVVQEGVSWRHLIAGVFRDQVQKVALTSFPDHTDGLVQFIESEALSPDLKNIVPKLGKTDIENSFILRAKALAILLLKTNAFLYEEDGSFFTLFNAGSQYPMVWVRDMASIYRGFQSLNQQNKNANFLDTNSHWAELFLRRDDPLEGGTIDWFAPARRLDQAVYTGKNSILSDQELWTIMAVTESYTHNELQKGYGQKLLSIAGQNYTVSESMMRSVTHLLSTKWNSKYRCLMTGHVADWGDVGLSGSSESDSTKMHGPKVCGLYAQTLLYQTLQNFKNTFLRSDPFLDQFLAPWDGIDTLIADTQNFILDKLWMKDKGFFKIHMHIDAIDHAFDEEKIFALGSHVLLLESELLGFEIKDKILNYLISQAKSQNFFGRVLEPSYPENTFDNKIMDQKYEYQNGGIWDWYAPRAAFFVATKDYDLGEKLFVQIAERINKSGSFYEWYQIDGSPGHGRHYLAGAASFLWALDKMNNLKH